VNKKMRSSKYVSVYLPEETRRQLAELSKRWGENASSAMRRAIERAYLELKTAVDKKLLT